MSIQSSTPSQEEAVQLGIREWPQQVKTGEWRESTKGTSSEPLARYVLEGKGRITVGSGESVFVGPGTLVTLANEDDIRWKVTTPDMIVLTPGYEEGGKLVAVAAALIALVGALAFLGQ